MGILTTSYDLSGRADKDIKAQEVIFASDCSDFELRELSRRLLEREQLDTGNEPPSQQATGYTAPTQGAAPLEHVQAYVENDGHVAEEATQAKAEAQQHAIR
jgi:hypothetical protein